MRCCVRWRGRAGEGWPVGKGVLWWPCEVGGVHAGTELRLADDECVRGSSNGKSDGLTVTTLPVQG